MELIELIQLAQTDSEVACKAFTETFNTDHVTYFDQYFNSDPKLGYKINPNNQHLNIENFELMQNFLRSFGHLMKELRVICAHNISFKWIEMANLICTYCTTLKNLYLFNCIECEDPIENVLRKAVRMQNISRNPLRICKAIPTLESLKIENIFIESSINLSEFFPNLLSLDLIIVGVSDPSIIERNIPKLEHIGITLAKEYAFLSSDNEDDDLKSFNELALATIDEESSTNDQKDKNETNKGTDKIKEKEKISGKVCDQFDGTNIKNALAKNPQLQSLHLEMEMDIQFVDFINETLPNLQRIKFSFGQNDFLDHCLKTDIVFKCVTSASLGILGIISPPITFQQLKELDFATDAPQSIIYYIKQHNQLTNLHLICQYTDTQAFKIIKGLADLEHLYLIIENDVTWTARGLMRFLAECERLKTVMLLVRVDSSDQRNWRTLIAQNNVWEIGFAYEGDVFTIEKN